MRKLALLVAAALVVSAPMLATSSTDTFAAAKAKKKAATASTAGPEQGSIFQAFSDQWAGMNTGGTVEKRPRRAVRKKKAE